MRYNSLDSLSEVLISPSKLCAWGAIQEQDIMKHLDASLPCLYDWQAVVETAKNGNYCAEIKQTENLLIRETIAKPRSTAFNVNPKITVIIPTINRKPAYLHVALASIFKQTYPLYEIHIIGDGVVPDTVYDDIKDRLQLTKLPYQGIYPSKGFARWHIAARNPINFGIACSNSEIVVRLDDDDYLLANHFEKIVERYLQTDGHCLIHTLPADEQGNVYHAYNKDIFKENITYTCTMAYCGDTINHMMADYQCLIPGDWHTYLKILTKGFPLYRIDEVTSVHRTESHFRGDIK